MPIDKTSADAMLDTFRNMMNDCREKGYSGEYFDKMQEAMNRMEELALQMDDVMSFSGAMMQEDLYMKFSNNYTRVLTAAYKSDFDPNAPYDEKADATLMKQSLTAYKDAIKQIRAGKEQAKSISAEPGDIDILYKEEQLIKSIQDVIDLGESGISYAEWCRLIIEKGYDKALEGSVLSRDTLEFQYKNALAAAISPYHIQAAKRKLDLFDQMKNESKIGMPDPFRFQLKCDIIDWELEPEMFKWDWIEDKWEKLYERLEEWIMSYTSMAPYIFPWNQHSNPHASVKQSQACVPGILRAYEKMCQNYFGMNIQQMFEHPSFMWQVQYGYFSYSKVFTLFLFNEVLPLCFPNAVPPKELVSKAEKFYNDKLIYRPDTSSAYYRMKVVFDEKFGEGEYVRRFGLPGEGPPSNAEPWTF